MNYWNIRRRKQIRLKTEKEIHTIPSALFGVNIVYSWEKDKYWTPGEITAMDQIENAYMRYPGGEIISKFHYDEPNGRGFIDTWHPGWDPKKAAPTKNWMSLNEYWSNKDKLGALAMLGVNARSGWKFERDADGLAEANRLAQHVKNNNWDVGYWFIDNEQHLKDDLWTPELYAHYINAYADEIKKWHPEAKFVANWKTSAVAWEPLLKLAGRNIQLMDIHVYWNKRGWGTLTWNDYVSTKKMKWKGKTFDQTVSDLLFTANGFGHNRAEVGFLEWGIGPSPKDMNPSRFQSAFIVANMFMEMIKSKLKCACYWPYRVPQGGNRKAAHRVLVDDNNKATVVYKFLDLFSRIKEYNLISARSDRTLKTIAAISPDKQEVVVYIINKGNAKSPVRLSDLDGFVPKIAVAISYSAPMGHTEVNVAEISSPIVQLSDDGVAKFELQGWSLTRIVFTKNDSILLEM